MANKIKVKVKSNVQSTKSNVQAGKSNQSTKSNQSRPMEIPLEAKATPTAVKQSTGLKTPNLTFKVVVDPKKT